METYDVVIVGGGPAGSTCAWKLNGSGLNVLVVDKQAFPRDKTCAGWVTPPVLDALQLDIDDYGQTHVFQPITGFRTGMIGGREVETRYDSIVSYGIRRCEFDHYLLARCGARRRLGEPLKSLRRSDGRWLLNDEISAPMLVGAGGNFCPVARHLGGGRDEQVSVVAAQEIEFRANESDLANSTVDPQMPELFFCDDLQGYGWCFRKGDYLNIGLGRTDHAQISSHVEAFVGFLREQGKVHGDVPQRFHGHAYRLYERTQPKLIDDGVLLIGDSAGLAYPQSGEGIRPAVESGLLAARTLLEADGDYARDRLAPYADRIAARFGRPRQRGAADWLPAGWLHFLAARLLASQWFSRRVVLDQWFLHSGQRPLAEASPRLVRR